MKSASDAIFLLIQSLSKSEKRYFRQYASRHTIGTENQYLSLFDAIQAQKNYDETALKQQLADSPYIHYFAVAKQYLYEQLTESLHHFHQAQSIEEQIKKQLHVAKILWRKKLTDQAKQALAKARKWMDEYGLHDYELEYNSLERKLLRGEKNLTRTKIQEAHQRLDHILQQFQKNNWYWQQAYIIMGIHYEKVAAQQAHIQEELNNIAQQLLQEGAPELPLWRLDYFKALATYYFMKNEPKIAASYNQQLLDLFQQHSYLIELERELYVAALHNFLIDNHLLGNYAIVEAGIAQLRDLPQQAIFRMLPNLEIKILEFTYNLQLNVRIAQQQFAEALDILPDLQKAIKKHQSAISYNHLLNFYYLMAYVYFANNQYENALNYLDELRLSEHKNKLEELLQAANRLYLLVHFELGNYLLLDNLLVSAQRAQRKQKTASAIDVLLFKYLKKIISAATNKETKLLYQKIALDLEQTKITDKRSWNYFDFYRWINGKLGEQGFGQ